MKILILTNKIEGGGAGLAALRLFEALRLVGVDCKIIAKEGSPTKNIDILYTDFFQRWWGRILQYGERLFLFSKASSKQNRFDFSTGHWGLRLKNHPWVKEADVIHLHWINKSFVSLDTIWEFFDWGKPVVWTFHDMWAFTGGCHYTKDCKKYIDQCKDCPILKEVHSGPDLSERGWFVKRKVYQNNHFIGVGCSDWLAHAARQSALLKGQEIYSIPNPIDVDFFAPSPNRNVGDRKVFTFLFVARSVDDHRKGFDLLLEALRKMKPVDKKIRLIIGGAQKEKVSLEGIEMDYRGFINGREQMKALYNEADCFLLPSREDNLPNTVVEASACGVPTIAFGVGGVPQMIVHQKTGYIVEPTDTDQWLKYMYEMIRMSERALLEMKALSRAFALKKYSPDSVAKKYLEIYQRSMKISE